MSSATNAPLWGASGLEWLDQHLLQGWSSTYEEAAEQAWARGDWLPQLYPLHAFRLVVRDVVWARNQATSLERLKRLLPVVAGFGNSVDTIAAMSLFGLLTLDVSGWSEETDVVRAQVERELGAIAPVGIRGAQVNAEQGARIATHGDPVRHIVPTNTVGVFIGYAWLGQAAAVCGQGDRANDLYAQALDCATGLNPDGDAWVGCVLHRIGRYIHRTSAHSLRETWRWISERWCERHPEPIVSARLQLLLQSRPDDLAGPVQKLEAYRQMLGGATQPADMELCVIAALLKAAASGRSADFTRARLEANRFGDPFWLHELTALEQHISSTPPAPQAEAPGIQFTFFNTFQGYFGAGQLLFDTKSGRRKVKHLLAVLLLQPRYRMVKDMLLQELFAGEDDGAAVNYLHVTMHRLRTMLDQRVGKPIDGSPWAAVQEGVVLLNEQLVRGVDVVDYCKRASVGHQLWSSDREAAIPLYRSAVASYQPVAPEFEYEEFMQSLRRMVQQHQLRMLRRLWDHAYSEGDPQSGLNDLESLYALDSFNLDVLRELCAVWCKLGEERRALQTCQAQVEALLAEGDPVPTWLTDEVTRLRRNATEG